MTAQHPASVIAARHVAGPTPHQPHRRPRGADRAVDRRRPYLGVVLGLILGLMASGLLFWNATSAVFSSTTSNPSDSWTLGSVTLSDDDTGSALFSASGLVPGSTGSNCITVSYTGNVATTVKLYAAASADASSAAQYLDLTIQEGSGGGFGSCGAFSASSTIYTGTLATFTSTKVAYASGVGSWAPSSSSSTVYKITYTLNASTPSAKQGAVTTATLQWESQA